MGEMVLGYVVHDIGERARMGERKYGTVLRTHNGRDALWDAYQEALDLCMYLRQEILERRARNAERGAKESSQDKGGDDAALG
jgi:hypothetical protein